MLRITGLTAWLLLAAAVLFGGVLHPGEVRSRWGSPCGGHPWADALTYGASAAFLAVCVLAAWSLVRRCNVVVACVGLGLLLLGVASASHGRTYACITDDYSLSHGPTTLERVLIGVACAGAVVGLTTLKARRGRALRDPYRQLRC